MSDYRTPFLALFLGPVYFGFVDCEYEKFSERIDFYSPRSRRFSVLRDNSDSSRERWTCGYW